MFPLQTQRLKVVLKKRHREYDREREYGEQFLHKPTSVEAALLPRYGVRGDSLPTQVEARRAALKNFENTFSPYVEKYQLTEFARAFSQLSMFDCGAALIDALYIGNEEGEWDDTGFDHWPFSDDNNTDDGQYYDPANWDWEELWESHYGWEWRKRYDWKNFIGNLRLDYVGEMDRSSEDTNRLLSAINKARESYFCRSPDKWQCLDHTLVDPRVGIKNLHRGFEDACRGCDELPPDWWYRLDVLFFSCLDTAVQRCIRCPIGSNGERVSYRFLVRPKRNRRFRYMEILNKILKCAEAAYDTILPGAADVVAEDCRRLLYNIRQDPVVNCPDPYGHIKSFKNSFHSNKDAAGHYHFGGGYDFTPGHEVVFEESLPAMGDNVQITFTKSRMSGFGLEKCVSQNRIKTLRLLNCGYPSIGSLGLGLTKADSLQTLSITSLRGSGFDDPDYRMFVLSLATLKNLEVLDLCGTWIGANLWSLLMKTVATSLPKLWSLDVRYTLPDLSRWQPPRDRTFEMEKIFRAAEVIEALELNPSIAVIKFGHHEDYHEEYCPLYDCILSWLEKRQLQKDLTSVSTTLIPLVLTRYSDCTSRFSVLSSYVPLSIPQCTPGTAKGSKKRARSQQA